MVLHTFYYLKANTNTELHNPILSDIYNMKEKYTYKNVAEAEHRPFDKLL